MVVRLVFAVVAGVVVAIAFARPAHAQMPLDGSSYAFPVPDYVGSLVGANSLDPNLTGSGDAGDHTPRKRARRPAAPTRKQLATLRLKLRSSVTQRVYQRVVDRLGADVDAALLTQQLDAAKTNFRAVMTRVGWSPSDVADVATLSLVQGYIIWHEVENVSPAALSACAATCARTLRASGRCVGSRTRASRRSPRSWSCA